MITEREARRWYEAGDPVHGFDHVRRVRDMALHLGAQVGADLDVVEAAAWLHDVSGAAPSQEGEVDERSSHEESSATFARKILEDRGWAEPKIRAVEHCIKSHRYRGGVEPESLEARVLFDADKLDVIGAFGIARTLGYAFQADQPAYAPVSAKFKEQGEIEPGEPHSAYHEYLFKLRHVKDRLHTTAARELAQARESLLHAFFDQLRAEAEHEI